MLRKLMTSTAVLALVAAGAINLSQAQAAGNETEANTTQTMVQEGAAQTDMNQTGMNKGGAEDMAGFANLTDGESLATLMIGRSVYSSVEPDAEHIGDVNDLIIGSDHKVTDAVIGAGGFLGLGEKNVVVPFDSLDVVDRNGELVLAYGAALEDLQSAPAFNVSQFAPKQPRDGIDKGTVPEGVTATDSGTNEMAPPLSDEIAASDQAMAPEGGAAMPEPQTAPNTEEATTFVTAEEGQYLASTLIGEPVYSSEDERIGEISDLVLAEDGMTRAAVIDVGGFLGIGEKPVALAIDQIKMVPTEETGDEVTLHVNLTREELESRPAFQYAPLMESSDAGEGIAPTGELNPTTTKNLKDTESEAGMATAVSGDEADHADPFETAETDDPASETAPEGMPLTDITGKTLSAQRLIGTTVFGAEGQTVGEVGDVVFTPEGRVEAVTVDVGGFLGIGEKPVAVPLEELDVSVDEVGNIVLTMDATEAELENMPAYSATEPADMPTYQ